MRAIPPANGRRPTRGGFTLAELLIALVVTTMVMGSVLLVFQLHSRMARTQTQVAEMQQSQRVVHYDIVRFLRMAGRGGLPANQPPDSDSGYPGQLLPTGVSVEVDNNVAANTRIGDSSTPLVVANTDVVTVRGVITGSMFQLDPASVTLAGNSGSATVSLLSPSGVRQNLRSLGDAIRDLTQSSTREALLFVSPLAADAYAIGELTSGSVDTGTVDGETVPVRATLNFVFSGGNNTPKYLELMASGAFPSNMNSAAFVGVLEEYRYYVRQDHVIPSDTNSEVLPRLSRARFYPNTDVPHASDPDAREDIADNVLDLQVALGIDSNNDGTVTENPPGSRDTDEWLFNDGNDTTDSGTDPSAWSWNSAPGFERPLNYVRVTTLVRSDRRQLGHMAELIEAIEDHDYDESAVPDPDEALVRSHRRRLTVTTIDLRNL